MLGRYDEKFEQWQVEMEKKLSNELNLNRIFKEFISGTGRIHN